MGAGAPPLWASRLHYGERFGIEPHRVNPPLLWWARLSAYDHARARRRAREWVDEYGMTKADEDTRRLYNELILDARNNG